MKYRSEEILVEVLYSLFQEPEFQMAIKMNLVFIFHYDSWCKDGFSHIPISGIVKTESGEYELIKGQGTKVLGFAPDEKLLLYTLDFINGEPIETC